ncbi:Hypothetical protein POVN_LOCUS403 [uncultured virus]|nr:Hypothetical protein POVN_LOCUS403 [uncultured virus]
MDQGGCLEVLLVWATRLGLLVAVTGLAVVMLALVDRAVVVLAILTLLAALAVLAVRLLLALILAVVVLLLALVLAFVLLLLALRVLAVVLLLALVSALVALLLLALILAAIAILLALLVLAVVVLLVATVLLALITVLLAALVATIAVALVAVEIVTNEVNLQLQVRQNTLACLVGLVLAVPRRADARLAPIGLAAAGALVAADLVALAVFLRAIGIANHAEGTRRARRQIRLALRRALAQTEGIRDAALARDVTAVGLALADRQVEGREGGAVADAGARVEASAVDEDRALCAEALARRLIDQAVGANHGRALTLTCARVERLSHRADDAGGALALARGLVLEGTGEEQRAVEAQARATTRRVDEREPRIALAEAAAHVVNLEQRAVARAEVRVEGAVEARDRDALTITRRGVEEGTARALTQQAVGRHASACCVGIGQGVPGDTLVGAANVRRAAVGRAEADGLVEVEAERA